MVLKIGHRLVIIYGEKRFAGLESGVLWCSQDLDLSLLLLVFSLIFTVV